MRILELFAGYGSQALALENLGVEFVSDISEIDKYAIQAYNQLHGKTHNWGDITKIDESKLPYYDLITYSFPCTSVSTAGLQRGADKGSGTASSLLWECERIIRAVKPKYLLMENVKNLVGKKHKHNFIKWLNVLEGLGYQNFYKVLNAKDFGIPQNRERVFIVSILGGGQYLFPNPIPLEKRLKDILEPIVDEKYYLSSEKVKRFLEFRNVNPSGKGMNGNVCVGDVCNTLTTNKGEGPKIKEISNSIRVGGRGSYDRHSWDIVIEPFVVASRGRNPENPSDRTTGSPTKQRLEINNTGCSNTLTSVQKDNYVVQQIGNIIETDSFGGNPQRGRIYSPSGCCPCLSTMQGGGLEPKILENIRIRKLTARECFRLMGVKDEQFDKLSGLSSTQLFVFLKQLATEK